VRQRNFSWALANFVPPFSGDALLRDVEREIADGQYVGKDLYITKFPTLSDVMSE
jgi:hypothetical protein